jgi:hypothetical protein
MPFAQEKKSTKGVLHERRTGRARGAGLSERPEGETAWNRSDGRSWHSDTAERESGWP